MRKTLTLLCAILSVVLTMAQQGFPKHHLLEHFTSEFCGNCPWGYDSIYQFTESNPSVIWVSHHNGFKNDEYTIKESADIVKINGVTGAPTCAINRTETFAPNSLSSKAAELSKTTFASVNIVEHSFDAATRALTLTVNGDVRNSSYSYVKLSICLTESGMMGKQTDYSKSDEQWEQYRHVHVPRVFLTAALGEKLTLAEGKYTKTLTTTLPEAWNVDNMSIVAYITGANDKPVLNAATTPIIKGTNGADHSKPEGLDNTSTGINSISSDADPAPRKCLHGSTLLLYVGNNIYDGMGRLIK